MLHFSPLTSIIKYLGRVEAQLTYFPCPVRFYLSSANSDEGYIAILMNIYRFSDSLMSH